MIELYNEKIMKIFKKPRNIGVLHKADAIGVYTDENSSESIKIYLKIENNVITESSFKAFAGAVTIACCQIATEKIVGLTLEEAMEFDSTKILSELGNIPSNKIRCSIIAVEGVKCAVLDYYETLEKEEKKRLRNERKEQNGDAEFEAVVSNEETLLNDDAGTPNNLEDNAIEANATAENDVDENKTFENENAESVVDESIVEEAETSIDEEENIYAQNAKIGNKHKADSHEKQIEEQNDGNNEEAQEDVNIFSKYPNMFKK